MKYDWKDAGHDTHYYYMTENGLIVGQVHNIAHTKIYMAIPIVKNEERFLGRYTTLEFAKKAIENYWDIQERTLLESNYGNV